MVTAKPIENYSKGEVQVKTWRNCEDGQVHISILDGAGKRSLLLMRTAASWICPMCIYGMG